MEIATDRLEGAAIVRFTGRLDTTAAPETLAHLEALIQEAVPLIVVDLTAVDFVSSAGLRVLLATAKGVGSSGSMRLFGLNASVQEVFDVSGFSTILAIFADEASALA
jgi:anti-anti-sigma factor